MFVLLNDKIADYSGVDAIILLVFGAILCFLGYKFFKVQIAIFGFLAGFTIGVIGISVILANPAIGIAVGIVGGVLFALLALKFYVVGVFLIVGALGFQATYLLSQNILLSILLGIILGIIGAVLTRHMIIIITAVSGGIMIGAGTSALLGIADTVVVAATIVAYIVAGLLAQYKMNPKSSA